MVPGQLRMAALLVSAIPAMQGGLFARVLVLQCTGDAGPALEDLHICVAVFSTLRQLLRQPC